MARIRFPVYLFLFSSLACSSGSTPLVLRGSVVDLSDDSPVGNARVVALDANGSMVSTVAETDADGDYEVQLVEGTESVTLRADAAGYQTFPSGLRQALPVDTTAPQEIEGKNVVESTQTTVGLIPLPEGSGTGSISGHAQVPDGSPGVLIVAETGSPATGTSALADREGNFKIFNLPAGTYSVKAYAKGANFDPADVAVEAGENAEVNLSINDEAPATLQGSVQIVNAPGGSATSVILVVESTFNSTLVRGETPPGLRAPALGTDPDITGAFTIEGIPAGRYVVLAAFENDGLVRDPDTCISGTDILHQEFSAGETVTLSSGFKITGALAVLDPGADTPEAVTTDTPTFSWEDDSSEESYHIAVVDSFGNLAWETDIPGVSGSNPSVTYAGDPLTPGMFYQFRVTSSRTSGEDTCEISQTEDLRGVFYRE